MNTSENRGDAQTITLMKRDRNQVYMHVRVSTTDTFHIPSGGTFQSAECFGESDPCTADTHLHPSPTEPRCWEST